VVDAVPVHCRAGLYRLHHLFHALATVGGSPMITLLVTIVASAVAILLVMYALLAGMRV
jgi:hypothetical protein